MREANRSRSIISKLGFSMPRFGGAVDDFRDAPSYPLASHPIDIADSVPVRLSLKQRKTQRMMRAILLSSSYTDKVDTEVLASEKNRTKRQLVVAKEVLTALGGILVCRDLVDGARKLVGGEGIEAGRNHIVSAIEVARRYKIMNPDLLRTDYVKFLYLVQDAGLSATCLEALGGSVVQPIKTVGMVAKELGVQDMLADERLPLCITPIPKIRDRNALNRALRRKDQVVAQLCKDWSNSSRGVTADQVELLVRSLNDANTYSDDNAASCEAMLKLFHRFFTPHEPSHPELSLAIREGVEGSRLSHEHMMQYTFVMQSLTLWKNICSRMFELWIIAEEDLLNPANPYDLRDTGQGLHRVQPAPQLYTAIEGILADTKRELGQWVGSERIHMGDNQVPNAFYFIDKYAQISRIIVPVLRTIAVVGGEDVTPPLQKYCNDVFGSCEGAQRAILQDFFRHAFDGSGGDNMDDAGSCIDGRLTSAWNWCNQIRSKAFYPLFMLAGFNSFDGDLTL